MFILDLDQDYSEETPLVSICMTSYNSAEWLPRAVKSVFQQRTAFPFELVIGDDCSTDKTSTVLHLLQAQHPKHIRVLNRVEKLGMQRNYYDTFEHCRGKYIAWLDADDYWTDPNKLNAQVAALEADESISACGHYVRQVNAAGEIVRERCPNMSPGRYGLADIIAENFIPSPSIMFRNGVHRTAPPSFFALSGLVDWPILLQSALAGDLLLLDGVMATYVLTPGSAYMSKGPLYQDSIDLEFYREMKLMLPDKWHRAIRAAEGKRYEVIARHLVRMGKVDQAREAARQGLRVPHLMDNVVSKVKILIAVEVLARWPNLRTSS
jgi:glycosyltransferase involved in cell wall biosynthesis